jgi:hypothetical protein
LPGKAARRESEPAKAFAGSRVRVLFDTISRMDCGMNVVGSFSGEVVPDGLFRVSFVTAFDPTFGKPSRSR